MFLPVTTLVAVIIASLFVFLSVRVIGERRSGKVPIGDGGNETLQRRIRGQANLAEYGPIGLFLIFLAELQSTGSILLLPLAAIFVAGRLMHGYAFGLKEHAVRSRVLGMQCTLLGIVALISLNLWVLLLNFIR
ncbi:MAG: MAPEG family protein [Rhizobiaceae bacterium]